MPARKKRQSIVTVAQMIAMLSIALFAFSLIVFALVSNHSEQKQRTKQMRASYVSLQKDITRREVERVVASINERRGNSRQIAMDKAKGRAYQAYAIAENIYKTFKDTKSQSEVLEIILSALRPVRFDQGKGYYFVQTLDGRILLIAGRPEIEGKHYSAFASKKEQAVVVSLIGVAKRKGEGIFEYKWTMPGKQGSGHHKISYLKLFKPYNLIIGTGLYLEDVEAVTKRELMEEITNIKYGNYGYFFINDFEGNVLAHGYQADMVGTSIWAYADTRGTMVYQELRKAIQNMGGVFCYYWWKMPEKGKERPKLAFAKVVPEWKWLIGTGVYLDEVEADIKNMQLQLRNESIREISLIFFVTIAIIILVYVIIGVLFRPLRRDISFFNECFLLAAQQNVSIDEEKIKFTELLKIAENANVMLREKEQFLLKLHDDKKEKEYLKTRLDQAQKMEAIGTLAGGIAHDFNNILSAVLGFTELALLADEKATPLEEYLQGVYAAGLRAKELVNQILTFARQSDEELKPTQVDSIIKEVLKFIRSSLPTTIKIKQNITSDSRIMGNSTQVHQILMNLCTNAAHTMQDEGGTLEITLKDITIDKITNQKRLKLKFGNYLELKISDTGTGIEPHLLEKIFDPYFTTKKPGEGTGMGLALVHGIVETYGGEIIVESTLGKGTVFTIYLPIVREKSAPLTYKSDESPTGQERILFVDDEALIVKIASRMLGQLGYSVTTRTSSVDALELFKSNPSAFDLVISDMTMPQLTGDLLTKKLIEIRPDIPVILCTGYSKRLSEEKAAEIGMKAFIKKPIINKDLAKTIRDVLDLAKD